MAGRTVPCREAFTRDDEGGGVGAEVEEELGEDVKSEEGTAGEKVVGEADGDKDAGEEDEAHELDGFAAQGVDGCDGNPVT